MRVGLNGTGPGGVAAPAAGRSPREEAAVAFAALLVEQLLNVGLGERGALGTAGGGYYRDLVVRTLAEQVAAAPGFALAARLAAVLEPAARRGEG